MLYTSMAPRLPPIIRLEPLCRSGVLFGLIFYILKLMSNSVLYLYNLSIYHGAEISIYMWSMNAHKHFSSWQVYFFFHLFLLVGG